MVTNGRPELTQQTIATLRANAVDWNQHELLVVFDGPMDACASFRGELLNLPATGAPLPRTLCTGAPLGVGGAKNFGVEWFSGLEFGEDDDHILMFSDNDMYYLPGWDARLIHALEDFGNPTTRITQLGGWRHPFHGKRGRIFFDPNNPTSTDGEAYEVDAATGNCFVMKWEDWFKYGPFAANAIGPGQSEDYALSQKIKAGGGIVTTLDPPVAIHCGIANCLGEPATGCREMSDLAETQMEKYGITKIWLSVPKEGTILLERNKAPLSTFSGINLGSGQRRFDHSLGWWNVDCISRPPDQIPDVVLDATNLVEHFGANTQDMVVLHHVLEHFGCGEADEVIRQCYKVLKPGGSLLVFVPNMRKLAGRWLSGEIDDYIFFVNTYGAYQGEDGDRHKWGFSRQSLVNYLDNCLKTLVAESTAGFIDVDEFDWRNIPGADIACDWWVLAIEIFK